MKIEAPVNLKEIRDFIDKEIIENSIKKRVTFSVFSLSESTLHFIETKNFEYKGYHISVVPTFPQLILANTYSTNMRRVLRIKSNESRETN